MNILSDLREGRAAVLIADENMQAIKQALYDIAYEGSFARAVEDFRTVHDLTILPYIDRDTLLAIERQLGHEISCNPHYFAIAEGEEIFVEEISDGKYRALDSGKLVSAQFLCPAGSFSDRLIRLANLNIGKQYEPYTLVKSLMKNSGIANISANLNSVEGIEHFMQSTDFYFTKAISKLILDGKSGIISRDRCSFYTPERGDIFYFFDNLDNLDRISIDTALVHSAVGDEFSSYEVDKSNRLVKHSHSIHQSNIIGFAKSFA